MTVAEKIKAARNAAGITQKELGNRMGVSDASIAQYESGERNPKVDTLRRLATALGIELSSLISVSNEFSGESQPDFSKPIIPVVNALLENTHLTESKVIAGKLPTNAVIAVEVANDDNTISLKAVSICEAIELYLNDEGKQKVAEYVRDIMQIVEYRKENNDLPLDGDSE